MTPARESTTAVLIRNAVSVIVGGGRGAEGEGEGEGLVDLPAVNRKLQLSVT